VKHGTPQSSSQILPHTIMKRPIVLLLLLALLAGVQASAAKLIQTSPGVVTADLMARRTPQYDYDVPAPGSYEIPVLQPAADGVVIGTNGAPVRLHQLMRGRVVVLSFIYTRCADPAACMRATGVLSELQRISRQHPALARNMLLITLSFDPAHDSPEVMAQYGLVSLAHGEGSQWLFLTTRNQAELKPLLDAYGQRVDTRKTASPMGPYYHPLRVYLIDQQQQVRNIYSFGLLDPRLVAADAQTLLMRRGSAGIPSR
jgi:cytochrome oxidase Cu insertion factor (SCO1/SenC/PrrC family)